MNRATRLATFRPRVECLEDRTVPSLLPGNELLLSGQSSALSTQGDVGATVAAAPDGHFVATYVQQDDIGRVIGIYARLFNADSTPASNEILVNGQITSGSPCVAMDSAGDFVVAWKNFAGIFAQLYDPTGHPVGSNLAVDQGPSGG
jgi:hypothetical protein